MSDKSFKLIRMNDNVHGSSTGKFVLLGSNTSHTDFLPSFRGIGLFSSFDGLTIFFKLDQTRGNLRVVLDDSVELLSSLVESSRITFVTDFLTISGVGSRKEVFQISEFVKSGIRESKRVIDVDIFGSISDHQQILDVKWVFEVFFFTFLFVIHQSNDSQIISVVLAFHKGFHSVSNSHVVQISHT